jgi:hypothetical protein
MLNQNGGCIETQLNCKIYGATIYNQCNFEQWVLNRRHYGYAQVQKKPMTINQPFILFLCAGLLDSKTTTQMSNFPDMSKVAEGDLKVPVFSDAFLHYNKGSVRHVAIHVTRCNFSCNLLRYAS